MFGVTAIRTITKSSFSPFFSFKNNNKKICCGVYSLYLLQRKQGKAQRNYWQNNEFTGLFVPSAAYASGGDTFFKMWTRRAFATATNSPLLFQGYSVTNTSTLKHTARVYNSASDRSEPHVPYPPQNTNNYHLLLAPLLIKKLFRVDTVAIAWRRGKDESVLSISCVHSPLTSTVNRVISSFPLGLG